jgi:deazaflavin-dependent oxidoreductase (nitroreductase family)
MRRRTAARRLERMSHALRRRLYRGHRPHRFAAIANRAQATLASMGMPPKRLVTLEVRGRRSGRLRSLPVVVAEYEGERYLVAMLGREANWVRNVRAAQGDVVLRHGRREAVHLDPVDPERRAPILKRYLELAPGARPHIPVARDAPLADFERLAADYPVFQITAAPERAPTLRRA